MNVTGPLVLRGDVVLAPVAQLAPDVRARFDSDDGDYTVSRLHGRMPSQVIDGATAALLELFRTPRTIAAAVVENSRSLGKDPQSWLDELLPFIGMFLQNRVLVPAGEPQEEELRPRLERRMRIGEWEVLRCVHLIEDSEVYHVRRSDEQGALKIAREAAPAVGTWLANEERILRLLDGHAAPRLLDAGTHDGRAYLVVGWCEGNDSGTAASRARHDRATLLAMCVSIADAYAALHERGVVHADVHTRNVIIGSDHRARLIDFGVSRLEGEAMRGGRAGMDAFFEPEMHAAAREGRVQPPTFAGEQYAVAALLYMLIAGRHYLELRYERDEMARQIAEEPPLPLAPPWPEVEPVLLRSLSKDPAARWPSMRAFANALRDVQAAAPDEVELSDDAVAFAERELKSFARGGDVFERGYGRPEASVNYGAAGAALALLRVAAIRSDAQLLALAEIWRSRAAESLGRENGWYDEEHDLPKAMLGEVSPYHTAAGFHAAAALIAQARGDETAHADALRGFEAASRRPCESIDLTLGISGTLLAAALLFDESLRDLGDSTMRKLWGRLNAQPPISECPPDTYLGLAHGWSGYLYATLRWCAASGAQAPPALARRLRELADLRVKSGRGALWPRQINNQDAMPGWCNGSAGHVFLWIAAGRLDLAEEAAWNTWEEPLHTADLCCGSAGRAYALLAMYRATGAREWLSRAKALANHAGFAAGDKPQGPHSLWKGELGVALLIAELGAPEQAAMPMFEA